MASVSYELSRDLKVTQRTAWFMLHRVRHAMHLLTNTKMTGEVEADECFVGGKIKNIHKKARRRAQSTDGNNRGKTVVLGLILEPHLESNLEKTVKLYTDEHPAYGFSAERLGLAHEIINHLESYVNGRVHTMEWKISGRF